MTLRLLFGVHAILTLAAGIVLVAAPGAIPGAVGVQIERGAYRLCYLLAASEFGIAALSWGARAITDLSSFLPSFCFTPCRHCSKLTHL
jgi:hypothetical protein